MSKRGRTVNNLDRISVLSDDVLGLILSYLPTKEAVATSILSKRWEYVWTSIFNIDFSDHFDFSEDYEDEFRMFKDYVDKVLFHLGGYVSQKCYLSCNRIYTSAYLYAWICAVVDCKVQEFTLQSRTFIAKDLPWSLFTCKSLVVVKIEGRFVLNLPSSFCLPNLKTLHLDSVIYVDNASMQRLFSGCPSLEELNLARRQWDGVQILTVSIRSLKRLSIFSNFYISDDNGYVTEINAPNLEYLKLGDAATENYLVSPSPSLIEARVSRNCVYGLLQGIQHVKLLALSGDTMTSLQLVLRNHDMLTFQNLSRLELGVTDYVDWSFLPNLLGSAPNLEVLVFPQGLVVPQKNGSIRQFHWVSPEHVPECFLLSLKTIEIRNFVGVRGEMYLVDYLLESSLLLERMMIHRYGFHAKSRVKRKFVGVEDEIRNAPRGSAMCQLEFLNFD